MKKIKLIKANTEQIIGNQIWVANNFFARFKGLMLRKALGAGEGLLLTKTKQIHTLWMVFSIDVVYLKKIGEDQYQIVDLEKNMKPWSFGKYKKKATDILELKQGIIEKYQIRIEEKIIIVSEKGSEKVS